MDGEMENRSEIPKGTLVSITGLESEAGKALNGGRGVVLGRLSSGRMPVLVYALLRRSVETAESSPEGPRLELASSSIKRSIRPQNMQQLQEQKCPAFMRYAQRKAPESCENGDYKSALFYCEAYHDRWPEDFRFATTYANLIREGRGGRKRPEEAWTILRAAEPHVPADFERMNEFRYDMAACCCAANEDPEVALEWALKISTETTEHRKMACEIINAVRAYSRQRSVESDGGDASRGPELEVHRRAAMAMLELCPDSAGSMQSAAAAECLLGRNREGAELYRRALETGQLRGDQERDVRDSLSLAQMQCPGGPMEHYRVLGERDGKWMCIHNGKLGTYDLVTSSTGMFALRHKPGNTEELQMVLFPIPHPDDPDAFGEADFPR